MITLCPHCGKEGLPLEITTLPDMQPGSSLVVQTNLSNVSREQSALIAERIRVRLNIAPGVGIAVLPAGWRIATEEA